MNWEVLNGTVVEYCQSLGPFSESYPFLRSQLPFSGDLLDYLGDVKGTELQSDVTDKVRHGTRFPT